MNKLKQIFDGKEVSNLTLMAPKLLKVIILEYRSHKINRIRDDGYEMRRVFREAIESATDMKIESVLREMEEILDEERQEEPTRLESRNIERYKREIQVNSVGLVVDEGRAGDKASLDSGETNESIKKRIQESNEKKSFISEETARDFFYIIEQESEQGAMGQWETILALAIEEGLISKAQG